MVDINEFGKYRLGLTRSEIKAYLAVRWNELVSPKEKIKKIGELQYLQFCKIAGVNICAVIREGKKDISLMYRHDVERYADKLFLNKSTYFD